MFLLQILPPLPILDSASTRFFDFIGGNFITLYGNHFKSFPGTNSVGSTQCIYKMVGGSRTITVTGEILDPGSGKLLRCSGTAVDENTLETGGLFGPPFQSWNVQIALSDGRQASSNLFIQTQCKNSTRFLNHSLQVCSRCPPFSFSNQPDASMCLCEKGSIGIHPVCRRCPKIAGFDCTRDNMTSVGKCSLDANSIFILQFLAVTRFNQLFYLDII